MCDPKIGHIKKVCGTTYIKGIKMKAFLTTLPEVTAIPDPTTDTLEIDTNVTFRSAVTGPPAVAAGQWWEWDISTVKGTWKVEPQGDEDNPTFKVTVDVFIHGITPERSYTVNQTLGHQFLAVVGDNHGNNRLVGEMGRGCTVKMGEEIVDSNGYKGTIEWETGHLPYFYNGTLPT